jgi:HD-GYP domain-containing protein (c-di-GMP phosphodiesterase class II)
MGGLLFGGLAGEPLKRANAAPACQALFSVVPEFSSQDKVLLQRLEAIASKKLDPVFLKENHGASIHALNELLRSMDPTKQVFLKQREFSRAELSEIARSYPGAFHLLFHVQISSRYDFRRMLRFIETAPADLLLDASASRSLLYAIRLHHRPELKGLFHAIKKLGAYDRYSQGHSIATSLWALKLSRWVDEAAQSPGSALFGELYDPSAPKVSNHVVSYADLLVPTEAFRAIAQKPFSYRSGATEAIRIVRVSDPKVGRRVFDLILEEGTDFSRHLLGRREDRERDFEKNESQHLFFVDARSARLIKSRMSPDLYELPSHLQRYRHVRVKLEFDSFAREDLNSPKVLEALFIGAAAHDVGKRFVPLEILNKHGKLTLQEYELLSAHSVLSYALYPEVTHVLPHLGKAPFYSLFHHERWDGQGYPFGIKGTDIPIEARILAIVDTFHAMTGDRPYRKGVSIPKALAIMENEIESGQWDPHVLRVFLDRMREHVL